jgi:CRP/FNR family transcriptional regulator, cyclic AMP receptor protein
LAVSTGEFFGYVASALVFATFYMRTMLPLRAVAIASNVAFVVYASIEGLTPILILHSALLPLNVLRLVQLRELTTHIAEAAQGAFSPQAILPLMKQRKLAARERLFSANEPADELYYIISGTLFLPEVQKEVGPGQFIGEFALFSDTGRRTATAIATTDCTIMVLTKKAVFATLLQHPQLGIHLLKLITVRMLQNVGQHDPALAPKDDLAPAIEGVAAGRFSPRFRRRAIRVGIVALCVALIVLIAFRPLYIVLDRDAALTTWVNVTTAPITGTVEGFDVKAGQSVGNGDVMRIVNHSADHSAVIRADAANRRG